MQAKMSYPHVAKYQPTMIQELAGACLVTVIVLVAPLAGIFGFGGWVVSKIKRNTIGRRQR